MVELYNLVVKINEIFLFEISLIMTFSYVVVHINIIIVIYIIKLYWLFS